MERLLPWHALNQSLKTFMPLKAHSLFNGVSNISIKVSIVGSESLRHEDLLKNKTRVDNEKVLGFP